MDGIPRKKPLSARIWYRLLVCLVTLIFLILLALFGALAIVSYGPSPAARDLFVVTAMETSAAKVLPRLYFSEERIQEFIDANKVVELEEVSDGSLIHVPVIEAPGEEDIIIENIVGDTFKGKMMIVKDPSRLLVGTSWNTFNTGVRGKTVAEIVARHEGVAGVNAGGFVDDQGVGDGSTPLGIVISEGALKWGSLGGTYEIIGIDEENKLVIGKMTGREALERGVRDAVSFGPMLIVNGEALEIKGAGSGLNPRTAIGQRADGAILLLTIDGRQPNSLGGTMSDVIDLMVQYEAVNAANLDGGSSTVMVYEGEVINVCGSLYGPRAMPTAIVVK
jgi:exopolysaccharide biosynthesis protein